MLTRETDVATEPDASGPASTVEEVAGQVLQTAADVLTKPRARGWIHLVSAVVAVAAGASLIAVSWPLAGLKAGLATFVYTGAVVAMFTVSATYHRVTWKSATARTWMKRLDHSMIFVFIAGTYTPFALLAMPHRRGDAGAVHRVGRRAGRGVAQDVLADRTALGRCPALPAARLGRRRSTSRRSCTCAGVAAMVLLVVGGALYSIGGILYALRWPDPWPNTFGYHEFFHACTAVAAICHYIAMWFAVFYVGHPA